MKYLISFKKNRVLVLRIWNIIRFNRFCFCVAYDVFGKSLYLFIKARNLHIHSTEVKKVFIKFNLIKNLSMFLRLINEII